MRHTAEHLSNAPRCASRNRTVSSSSISTTMQSVLTHDDLPARAWYAQWSRLTGVDPASPQH